MDRARASGHPRAVPDSLEAWLAHCERLHPLGIDMGLQRVRSVAERLALRFAAPVVSVAGTNGKGSSCAMLEAIALQAGYRVGLYSKPHLVRFEERCRVGGHSLPAQQLIEHFAAVEAARGDITLTYFEFTTLAILRALSLAPLDLVILEVGLGGRLDAVNVVDADVALITSIDLDHMEWLGSDREAIGFEKAGILRAGRCAVVSDPLPPHSVVRHAQDLGVDLWLVGRDFNHAGDRQQWSWAGRGARRNALAYPALRGANQLLNASGVLAVFEALRERLPISAQAVRRGLATVRLTGRFQIVPGQPALVLDVAHNPHAVAVMAANLEQMGSFARTHAVFGAMADKDIAGMVLRVAAQVDNWHLCNLPWARAAKNDALAAIVRATPGTGHAGVHRHDTPALALRQALAAADRADRIVVFGSFLCVGGVLQGDIPRLAGVTVD